MKTLRLALLTLLLTTVPALAQFKLMQAECLGKLRVNMSRGAVLSVMGKPTKRSPEAMEQATGMYVEQWTYPQGITLKMSAEKPGGKGKATLSNITIEAPCYWCTARGVHIGCTEAEVRQVYGKDIDKETSDATHIVAGSPYGGLAFTLAHGRVIRIFLGAAAD